MRRRIGYTILFFWIAALAFACSSQSDRVGGAGEGRLEETVSAPTDTLSKPEEDLVASAEGEHNKAVADFPVETN